MDKNKIDLKFLANALKSLKEASHPQNKLERDGAIQRLKYTFELSWKTLAKLLSEDRLPS